MNLALKMCEGWGCNVGMGVIDCDVDIAKLRRAVNTRSAANLVRRLT
jgi:hypothetical protein